MPRRPRNIDKNKYNFIPFVDTLPADNFQKTIESKKAAFVLFYDPRLPTCKAVRNPFVELAQCAASKFRGFYAVDCLKNKELCDCLCVGKYPSFKLFVNGYYLNDYDSAVNVQTMKTFVEKAPIPGQCRHKQQRNQDDEVFCSLCFAEAREAHGSGQQ